MTDRRKGRHRFMRHLERRPHRNLTSFEKASASADELLPSPHHVYTTRYVITFEPSGGTSRLNSIVLASNFS